MKRIFMIIGLLLVFCVHANAASPERCVTPTGDYETISCDANAAQYVNVASGTLTITLDADTLYGTHNAMYTALTDGTDVLEITASAAKVFATDFDIRDLTAASDTVSIEGGNTLDVSIDDGGNVITVDATDLDIRNLTAASDTVTVSGSLTPSYLSTTEFINYGVPATSASGTNLDPAASSTKFTIQNNHDETVWVKVGATPAVNDGIKLVAGATWIVEDVTVTDLEVYNPDGSSAQIAVNYWR